MNTAIFLSSPTDKSTAERVNSDLFEGPAQRPSDGAWVALSGVSGNAHSLYVKLLLLAADAPDLPVEVSASALASLMGRNRGDKVTRWIRELSTIGAVTVVRGGMPRRNTYLVHRDPPAAYVGHTSMQSWAAENGEVVYYARRDNGDIKIGTTAGIPRQRMNELRQRYGTIAEVIAVEPGGPTVEAQRHREFALSRVDGEWFQPTDELLRHIRQLGGA